MASEEERNEYVMMDVGAIWRGTTRYSSGMQWNFGQFEEGILDTTLDVLNSDKECGFKGMYEVGKSSWKDRSVGKFYVGKIFPSSCLYMKDHLVGNFFPP